MSSDEGPVQDRVRKRPSLQEISRVGLLVITSPLAARIARLNNRLYSHVSSRRFILLQCPGHRAPQQVERTEGQWSSSTVATIEPMCSLQQPIREDTALALLGTKRCLVKSARHRTRRDGVSGEIQGKSPKGTLPAHVVHTAGAGTGMEHIWVPHRLQHSGPGISSNHNHMGRCGPLIRQFHLLRSESTRPFSR